MDNENSEKYTENDANADSFDDLGDFALDEFIVKEKPLTEDLAGFASGFPDWDLHPPKK